MRLWSFLVIPVAVSFVVAACGGGDSSIFPGGVPDGGFDGTTGDTGVIQMFPDAGGDGGGSTCVPTTCAKLGYTCGTNADGCGNSLDCGSCMSPTFCGGGGFSQCGGNTVAVDSGGSICVAKTCAQLGYTCGKNSDGCGNLLDCGTCAAPQFCGGGGYSICGGNSVVADGGSICVPTTCAALGYNCGPASDGCGGALSCGTCTAPQYCGGGGFDKCGGNSVIADGGSPCVPKTCGQLGYTCGFAGDGCGGQLSCGSCTAPQFCGGGGFDTCGGNSVIADGGSLCVPKTCAQLGYTCGPAGDGCGNQLNCGSCLSPQFCGGGGFNTCGGNLGGLDGGSVCVPKTCAQLGYNCGPAGDGCGNQLNCGTCTAPEFCGGGGPSVCGPTNIVACDGGTTTLSGFVYDPGNNLPVYNALVYVPVGAVQTPQTGVNPAVCGCTAPSAYASAYTGIDGSFQLSGVPSGNVQVVVELGKWQRVFNQAVTSCKANAFSSHLTLPSTRAQGNIPRFAVDTGNVDTMECVLLKMGIAQSEFVNPAISGGLPTAAGRIHLYEGSNFFGGAVIDANTPTEDQLTEAASVMEAYDVILFPCQGGRGDYSAANGWPNTYGNLGTYTADGGRIFTTHFHYDLLQPNPAFTATASWTLDNGFWNGPDPSYIDTGFARGVTLAQWLNQPVVYGGTYGQIPVNVIRNDFSAVNAPAQRWMYMQAPKPASFPMHYTFDTPFNKTPTCGRVVYSDFHVENSAGANGVVFPSECAGGGMTPQEKMLEFMIFDLTSCVSPPVCTKLTCAQQGITCGPAGDGCGGLLQCGSCMAPQTCGGGGVSGQCGAIDAGSCTPRTCVQQGIQCGPAGDGCGNLLQCGPCVAPQSCGGGGQAGICGYIDGGSCTPKSCVQQGIQCGPAGDGCGNALQCGPCVAPATCGGGGQNGVCGFVDGGSCTPQTCSQQGFNCGPAGDGCGNALSCGVCTPPATCGGGGQSGVCGFVDGGACMPQTCAQLGFNCGPAGDGCGGLLNCGPCTPPATCGGGGQAGVCGYVDGGTCVPKTCAQLGFSCGPAGDGCGGLLNCGMCVSPQTCGGGGQAGVCGGGIK